MGAAQSVDAPLGLQRHLTVPLFATSAVTGSGIPLLHAFLASLRSTGQSPASALVGAGTLLLIPKVLMSSTGGCGRTSTILPLYMLQTGK